MQNNQKLENGIVIAAMLACLVFVAIFFSCL
jgi:hypothetical protein